MSLAGQMIGVGALTVESLATRLAPPDRLVSRRVFLAWAMGSILMGMMMMMIVWGSLVELEVEGFEVDG